MAYRTRSGSVPGSSEQRQDLPPPPPPSPLEAILAAQTELLRHLVQGQQQQQPHGGRAQQQPHVARYEDFLGTQPPLFQKTQDPLDGDAWVRTIESKFELLTAPCPDHNKARFAA